MEKCREDKASENIASNTRMYVICGGPGSGKTSLSNAVIKTFSEAQCFALDLDVCVPPWMRENFARGIYPTVRLFQ